MINFNKYDQENPAIWELFQKYTLEAKEKGFKNYSANGIFEIIRWHTKESGNDSFKINNNYRPDYARKMMNYYPVLNGFFRLREMTSLRTNNEPII